MSKGTTSGSFYTNSELGFRYQLPKGWAVNDKETTLAHEFAWADNPGSRTQSSQSQCSKNLLFVTKHPEGMKLNSFDPMALMIAVDPECFPEITLPKSATERDLVQKAAAQVLRHLDTPGSVVRAQARVRAFDNAGRVMLEISRPLSMTTREVSLGSLTTIRNVNRSVLLLPAGGYWAVWIFVSGDDVDMDTLKTTKIFFDAAGESSATK
ncbi:MAG: hypothetical protein WCF26_20870 [Candidatus Sulfotelmatobacter sp.]